MLLFLHSQRIQSIGTQLQEEFAKGTIQAGLVTKVRPPKTYTNNVVRQNCSLPHYAASHVYIRPSLNSPHLKRSWALFAASSTGLSTWTWLPLPTQLVLSSRDRRTSSLNMRLSTLTTTSKGRCICKSCKPDVSYVT